MYVGGGERACVNSPYEQNVTQGQFLNDIIYTCIYNERKRERERERIAQE